MCARSRAAPPRNRSGSESAGHSSARPHAAAPPRAHRSGLAQHALLVARHPRHHGRVGEVAPLHHDVDLARHAGRPLQRGEVRTADRSCGTSARRSDSTGAWVSSAHPAAASTTATPAHAPAGGTARPSMPRPADGRAPREWLQRPGEDAEQLPRSPRRARRPTRRAPSERHERAVPPTRRARAPPRLPRRAGRRTGAPSARATATARGSPPRWRAPPCTAGAPRAAPRPGRSAPPARARWNCTA
jgi:hypothetical protein